MKTTLEILREARELISVPERWTTGASARTLDGCELYSGAHEAAVCWCAIGAIRHSVGKYGNIIDILGELDPRLDEWNDTHTHAEVLALFDRTIARMESEGAP